MHEDVVKPHNIQLLLKAMDPEMYEHPSYMPVTRDLSPSRIEMILKWLKSDNHYRNWSHVEEVLYTPPQFCQEKNYEFKTDKVTESSLVLKSTSTANEEDEIPNVLSLRGDDLLMNKFAKLSAPREEAAIPEWMETLMKKKKCTMEELRKYLQSAVTLGVFHHPSLSYSYVLTQGWIQHRRL